MQESVDVPELRAFAAKPLAIGARVERAELFLGGHPVGPIAALEDEAWFARTQQNRTEKQIVDLPQPVPIRVF